MTAIDEGEILDSEDDSLGILPLVGMAIFILVIQLIAILMAEPFEAGGFQAFSEPDSIVNPLMYVGLILAFTLFILIVIKMNQEWFIHLFILLAVGSTMYYVFVALLSNSLVSVSIAAVLTIFIYKFPEWYVIDTIGVIIGAGVTSIFGISLSVIPVMVLLIILAVYDAISVYKTKHMITLAESVMDMKMPILFVIPRRRGFSFLNNSEIGEGDAFFMGLGDAIMPSILVVSSNFFIEAEGIGFINYLSIGTIIGTLCGYMALMSLVGKGKPHAGLPFLNTGAILGFLAASAIFGIGFI